MSCTLYNMLWKKGENEEEIHKLGCEFKGQLSLSISRKREISNFNTFGEFRFKNVLLD